jgi:uncharacterized membrane protein
MTNKIRLGVSLGVGLTYFLDPDRGRRRRARVRDTATHLAHVTNDVVSKTRRDVRNRTRGLASQVNAIFRGERPSDEVLVERVRTKIGPVVSHPRAIEVTATQGRVTLSGPILAREVDRLLERIAHVRGVTGVENQLEPHKQAADIPSLQGGTPRSGETPEFLQASWSPTARLLALIAGGAMVLYGARRRGMTRAALGIAGGSLLARGMTNRALRPVERVYEVWRHPENFPHFMSRVREVCDLGDGRYRWTVVGPAGIPCSWTGAITRQVPNTLLEFASEPGSAIEHHGVVRFEPKDGGTRVDVKMSYRPPAGSVGHALAKLFGADPRSEMIDDLMRMKSFIETGRQPHDAAERQTAGA